MKQWNKVMTNNNRLMTKNNCVYFLSVENEIFFRMLLQCLIKKIKTNKQL